MGLVDQYCRMASLCARGMLANAAVGGQLGMSKVGGMWDVAGRNYADTLALRRILVSPQNIHTPGSTCLIPCNSH